LIRDSDYTQEFLLGFEGGEKYLAENVFKIKRGHSSEMKKLRRSIKDSYESIQCFLMPHPGQTVARTKGYDGHWSEIDPVFIEQLKKLVPSMLATENLTVKKIAGKEVTGESLYWYMQSYLKLFVSGIVPSPKSIYEATVTKFLEDMILRYATEYKESISKGSDAVITHTDFNILHLDSKKKMVDSYDAERKIGKESNIIYYRNKLINRAEEILDQQNQTLYYKIEAKMTDRKFEAQKNETLRQELKIQDLIRKHEEMAKKNEETQQQLHENLKKMDEQNAKIQNLIDTMSKQQQQTDKEKTPDEKKPDAKNDDIQSQTDKENKKREQELQTEMSRKQEQLEKKIEEIQKGYQENAAKYAKDVVILNEKTQDLITKLGDLQAKIVKIEEKNIKSPTEQESEIPQTAYLKQGDCYLCAQSSTYTTNRRKTACCDSEILEAEWLIEKSNLTYVSWDGLIYNLEGSYTIKNMKYGRYLYDAQYPEDNTLAIWSNPPPSLPNYGYWKITSLNNNKFHMQSPRGKYLNGDRTEDKPGLWEFVDTELQISERIA
jgi:hypothetical protein